MNIYANTTTLQREVYKSGLILIEPTEMGSYIGDVNRKIEIHSLWTGVNATKPPSAKLVNS